VTNPSNLTFVKLQIPNQSDIMRMLKLNNGTIIIDLIKYGAMFFTVAQNI